MLKLEEKLAIKFNKTKLNFKNKSEERKAKNKNKKKKAYNYGPEEAIFIGIND